MQFMRDSFLNTVYSNMADNNRIFVLSADVGAPALDKIRKDFPDRFINTGISEQNMINVATGLALEGYHVYAYGIAAFFLRAVDQIRNSLLLSHQVKPLNVNLLSTGRGISYETAGPTHHCLEDLITFSAFPQMELYVPSDAIMAGAMAKKFSGMGVKYFCCDGKKVPVVYAENHSFDFANGFIERNSGKVTCVVSMGGMLVLATEVVEKMSKDGAEIGLVDLFSPTEFDKEKLLSCLSSYKKVIALNEGYREEGILSMVLERLLLNSGIVLKKFGFDRRYIFEPGPREMHYKNARITMENILSVISR